MDEHPSDWDLPAAASDEAAGELAALRELALRLLSKHHWDSTPGYEITAVEIGAGQLPWVTTGTVALRAMPMGVPLPEASTVIGSLVTAVKGNRVYTIIVTAPGYAVDLVDWFDAALRALGWTESLEGESHHGPLPAGFQDNQTQRYYCKSARGPALVVSAVELAGRPTEIRLRFDTGPTYWCDPQRPNAPGYYVTGEAIIPPLRTPRDGAIQHPFMSTSEDSCGSSADLLTRLDLAATVAHYSDLLERAGWVRTDAGSTGPTVWSTWIFYDQRRGAAWRGTFLATPRPPDAATGKAQYYLHIHTYKI